jgi:hypothetical protein
MPFLGTTTALSAQTAINKKVTFGADGIARLKMHFSNSRKLSGLSISYNNSTLDDKRTVRLSKSRAYIGTETLELLKGTNFTFRQSGDNEHPDYCPQPGIRQDRR